MTKQHISILNVFLMVTIGLTVMLLMTACTSNPAQGPTGHVVAGEKSYKIGLAVALTGYANIYGVPELKGAQLALEELANKKKLGDTSIPDMQLVVEDIESDSTKAVSAVTKLITVDDVNVIVGPTWAGTFKAALPIGDQYDRVIIAPSDSITAMKSEVNYTNAYSVWFTSEQEMNVLVDYFVAKKYHNVVFLIQTDPFWEDMYAQFEKKADKLGITVSVMHFNAGEKDFRTSLYKIKSKNPDVVFFGPNGDAEMIGLLRQRMEVVPDLQFISSESTAGFIDRFGVELEGVQYITPKNPSKEFIQKYYEKYGEYPVFSASSAYDAVNIFEEALQNTDGSSEQIRSYLKNRTFKSATFGTIEFDDIGGIKNAGNFEVRLIHDGQTQFVWSQSGK